MTSTPPSDRLELMRAFVHIVQAGSLSAAAERMGATQPTVSRRLQALEASLGTRLLQRSTHAMKLTEAGERCYARARDLLARWDAFEADMRGTAEEAEGTLRVVVPHALGQRLLVDPLADYLRAHPRVTVDWLLHDRQPDFIAEGVDCAIHVGEVTDPNLVAIALSEVPRIVVAAPEVAAGLAGATHARALADLPWLALRTFYRTEILLTHAGTGESCRVPVRARLATDSLNALHHAAVLGLGACAASAWLLADDLARGRLVRLAPDWQAAPLPVYLVYPYAPFYPAKLRRFVETLKDTVADRVDRIG